MSKGKRKEPKVELPDGWWLRLIDLCRSKWHHDDRDTPSVFDLYAITKVSRRTLSSARKAGEMTARTFSELAASVGYDDHEAFLLALRPDVNPESDVAKRARELLRRAADLETERKLDESFDLAQEALRLVSAHDGLIDLKATTLASLCLLSSERSGRGDRRHYLRQLEPLQAKITDVEVLVQTYRAQASVFARSSTPEKADEVYQVALDATDRMEKPKAGKWRCILEAEQVHLLCNSDRWKTATAIIQRLDEYVRHSPNEGDGEEVELVMDAGLHWAASARDERAAIERILAMEASASTSRRAVRIGGRLMNAANGLEHSGCHDAALAAAQAALRLAEQWPEEERRTFLPGVLYTIAMIHYGAKRLEQARDKARALIDIPISEKSAAIRFAATQLLAVISREIGNVDEAVGSAQTAVSLAPELDSLFMAKMNLADALADQGQTERALKTAIEAYHLVEGRERIPMDTRMRAIANVGRLAAQLGKEDLVSESIAKIAACTGVDPRLAEQKQRHVEIIEGLLAIRTKILNVSCMQWSLPELKKELESVGEFRRFTVSGDEAANVVDTPITTLREANALTIAPMLRWWEDLEGDYKAASLDYDYWGRGAFARILRNLQAFPHALNVTVEVRTVDDIRQALRLWSLYADFVLLLWKGETESGSTIHFVDGEWFGPWGADYMLAMGDKLASKSGRVRFPALAYGAWLPSEVARCLATEIKPFLASGRVLLVPASAVGCVTPGHGALEQVLTEAANCVPILGSRQEAEQTIGLLPYARDIPLDVLFDFVGTEGESLREMRELILRRTDDVRNNGLRPASKALEREIASALRRLRRANDLEAKERELTPSSEDARIAITPFRTAGSPLASSEEGESFSPLLTLESMGYGWKIGGESIDAGRPRYQPKEDEPIGTWLAPPECGVRILTFHREDAAQTHEMP